MAFKMKGFPKNGDTGKKIYVSSSNEEGGYVSEDELESKFSGKGSDFPQYSVQDYSKVMKDSKGMYVVKLEE